MDGKWRVLLFATLTFVVNHAWAGEITGKVLFEGNAIKLSRLPMNADPYCFSQHKEPVYSQEVIVNSNGTLQNVLVYIKGIPLGTPAPPATPAVLRQERCVYTPHVLGVQVGQEFQVLNDDSTLHNVHTLSDLNPQFNIAQPIKGMKLVKKFNNPEIFLIKCEIHRWMGAYLGVFPTPFFSVTGTDGTFFIKGLPPGDYTVEAWHEKYGTQSVKISVGATETKTVDFKFKGA